MQSDAIPMPKPQPGVRAARELPPFHPKTRWWLLLQLGVGVVVWTIIVAAISLVV